MLEIPIISEIVDNNDLVFAGVFVRLPSAVI